MLVGKNIIVSGLNIRYYQSADFNPAGCLVFLHGWGSEALHFQKTLEKCANFVALDLPGFGGSELPKEIWSLDDYVKFTASFFEKLNIKNPAIVGHSFGGSIGIKYCVGENDVKKLILIDSAGVRRKTVKKLGFFVLAKIFKIVFSLPVIRAGRKVVRQWFYKTIDSEDYINAGPMTKIYQKIISEDLTAQIQKIQTPTIIIWGADDLTTPLADGQEIQRNIAGSKLFVIPGAKHYVFLDQEQKFNEIFLAEIQ